ncbi:uncharacterized protein B0I36DRAFT_331356 [Microdochium trichocladiopsis]|uniref:Uncharacterized protein n=1 Tax=Microdochium trichocladiopsis TaxID=1682393 RepID=A0A9P8XX21_9PEZI|nr:uncharacterized protein B0I36DRAFT_331356 [Microdochium trichocladiopsis]KAH7024408.1 hypothetical protein B0I36DRAFT_331356 [Microdochium trichocladiopsis]
MVLIRALFSASTSTRGCKAFVLVEGAADARVMRATRAARGEDVTCILVSAAEGAGVDSPQGRLKCARCAP